MNTFIQNKFARLIIPVFGILFFLSCQKDISNEDGLTPGQPADLTTKVTSSVSGFVTDENNQAVLGANVSVGGFTTTTDKYGFFQVKNVQVVKNAATVTVNQPGYFKGIKTYIATDNKAAFFRIKLIPKTNVGTINAAAGGSVTLSNGFIIALPANGVVTAAGSAAYTGIVNVAAHWIDPTATDLNETMPGDLRGIGTDGSLKKLTTFGMAAVELTGASGELLQIAAGSKATLTMNIPSAIMGTAPATIPLWSFDETNGLWKQEGVATKTGNTYVGEVSHFSFWNCDVPNSYVHFDCTIIDQNGNPVPYAIVKISVVGNPYSAGYGYTDSAGYVGGAIPDNASLLLEVFSYYSCGNAIYSQNFSTTNTNISLGNITVNTATSTAVVSGTVTDCSNAPVTNGYIILEQNGWYYRYAVSTGSFSFPILLCSSASVNVTIIAEDVTGGQQSTPLSHTLVPGPNVLGNLQACGITTQEFLTYSTDGGTTSTTVTPPADSLYHSGNGTTLQSSIYGYTPGTPGNEVNFSYSNTGIAVGSTQTLLSFFSSATGQGTTTGTVNITEYGSVGQFISGNFTGVLSNTIPMTYNISGSFRVRRNF